MNESRFGAAAAPAIMRLPDEALLIEIERDIRGLYSEHAEDHQIPCGCRHCRIAFHLENYCELVRRLQR